MIFSKWITLAGTLIFLNVLYSQENDQNSDLKVSAVAELGFISVLDHRVQFGEEGTYFDYRKQGGQDVLFPVSRLSLEMEVKRSTFYLLYQPLRLESQVYLQKDLVIDGAVFPAGSNVKLLYNFPFYRLSYTRELFPSNPRFDFALGASMQIRNATISFESGDGSLFRTNRDIGIVPALKLKTTYNLNSLLFLEIEADGIYAPVSYLNGSDNEVVGAILDASGRIGAHLHSSVDGFLNLRYLGGGAVGSSDDVDGPGDGYVKNWLHTATVTAGFKFTF
ncbi:MAG: hypothetical protein R3277_00260 [Brumimicrobium sp.]|nr:hypothetical protein [Brumimicrobium sp.]